MWPLRLLLDLLLLYLRGRSIRVGPADCRVGKLVGCDLAVHAVADLFVCSSPPLSLLAWWM